MVIYNVDTKENKMWTKVKYIESQRIKITLLSQYKITIFAKGQRWPKASIVLSRKISFGQFVRAPYMSITYPSLGLDICRVSLSRYIYIPPDTHHTWAYILHKYVFTNGQKMSKRNLLY